MGDLEIFFGALIVVGLVVGVVVFASNQRNASRAAPSSDGTHLHRGINSASLASEGLGNLPGLLITVAFIFIFFGIFLPRNNQWFLVLFIATEIGVAVVYVLLNRRSRRESERTKQALHEINEQDHEVR
jgi:hypothetical protein